MRLPPPDTVIQDFFEIGIVSNGPLLVRSHRSQVHLLCTARFTRALRCSHLFTRSLFHSILSPWDSERVFVRFSRSSKSMCLAFLLLRPYFLAPHLSCLSRRLLHRFLCYRLGAKVSWRQEERFPLCRLKPDCKAEDFHRLKLRRCKKKRISWHI